MTLWVTKGAIRKMCFLNVFNFNIFLQLTNINIYLCNIRIYAYIPIHIPTYSHICVCVRELMRSFLFRQEKIAYTTNQISIILFSVRKYPSKLEEAFTIWVESQMCVFNQTVLNLSSVMWPLTISNGCYLSNHVHFKSVFMLFVPFTFRCW